MEPKTIKNEIMIKVGKKEAYLRNLNRCLAVKICPVCGNDLKCESTEINHDTPKWEKYRCLSATCAFTYAK